jgi:LPXTG-site transpeptidase (sortase) family protein
LQLDGEQHDVAMTITDDPPDTDPHSLNAAPVELISAPPRPARPPQRRIRRATRSLVVATLLLFGARWAFENLAADLIFDQRQQHLSGSFQEPKPKVREGDAFGVLQIPRLDLSDVIVEGATVDNLRGGPARLSGTALPGEAGAMVVFGHRDAYGGPFFDLAQLASGDKIVVQARSGGPIAEYTVIETRRNVRLAEVELEEPEKWAYLVLVTSEEGFLNDDQTLVIARNAPVNDIDAVVADLGRGPDRAVPLGIDTLLFNAAAVGAALTFVALRRRVGLVVAVSLIVPIAAVAVMRLLFAVDSILPLTR